MLPQQKEVDRSSCRRKTFSVCFRLKAEHCSKLKFFIQRAQTCCSETSRGVGIVVFSPARTKKKSSLQRQHGSTPKLFPSTLQILRPSSYMHFTGKHNRCTLLHTTHTCCHLCAHMWVEGEGEQRSKRKKERREALTLSPWLVESETSVFLPPPLYSV